MARQHVYQRVYRRRARAAARGIGVTYGGNDSSSNNMAAYGVVATYHMA